MAIEANSGTLQEVLRWKACLLHQRMTSRRIIRERHSINKYVYFAASLAVFAYSVAESIGPQSVYPYSNVLDYRNSYNRNTNLLSIPESGIYYFSLSAGVPANMAIDYSIIIPNGNLRPAALRTHTAGTGIDTISRDAILQLNRGNVNVRSGGNLYSDAFKLTSLSAFSISDTMSNPRYFYVYQPSGIFSNFGRIRFPTVLLNQPRDWDSNSDSYRCSQTGIYIFTFSVFVDPADIVRSQLNVGNKVYELLREHTNHGMNGGDVLSRTILTTCNAGDTVFASLNGGVIQGRRELTTGLMGFAYTPNLSKSQNVYWSLSRNTEVVNDGVGLADYLFTRLDEASFGLRIEQRSGNLYRAVVCPASGWYYVHLTAVTMPNFRMNLFVSVNGQRQMSLFRSSAWHNGGMDYMSRSGILRCRQGEQMSVQIGGRQAVGRTSSSRANMYGTTFLGFMLYSDNTV